MNRQLLLTKRSFNRSAMRFPMSVALIQSALLVAACSDDPASGPSNPSPSTTSTSSTSATSTTSTPVNPGTTTPVTPPAPTTVNPTPTSAPTTTSSTSSQTSSDDESSDVSAPPGTTLIEETTGPGASSDAPSGTIDLPTVIAEDAGADASVSEETSAETTDAVATSDTEGEGVPDASVTEPETSEPAVTEATSAPEVTSEPVVTSEEEPTSAPVASSSAEVTSDSPYGPNLITNPGFEGNSYAGWTPFGAGTVSATNAYAASGTYSGRITGRTNNWNGIGFNLIATASPDATYHVEAKVRTAAGGGDTLKLTFAVNCTATQGDATFHTAASGAATNASWLDLSGNASLPGCPDEATQLTFYIEGTTGTADIYVDDVSVREVL